MSDIRLKGLIAVVALTVISSTSLIVHCEPSFQIFSRPPPNDELSVMLKANRPNVPSMVYEFGPNDYAYMCNNDYLWITYRQRNYFDGWFNPVIGCASIWYAGNPVNSVWLLESSKNLSIPTMNLFPQIAWSSVDEMLTTTVDLPRLTHFDSFIATGVSSVTFFEGYDYEGPAVCMTDNPDSSAIYHYRLMNLGLESGIKSFRFGCFATNVVHLNNANDSINIHQQTDKF